MNNTLDALKEKLRDERTGKVVFISHCLLNENTRYLGGAFCTGMARNIVNAFESQGCGIVQLPCPEQLAWGGVLKKYMLISFGIKHSSRFLFMMRKFFLMIFMAHTRRIYRKLARSIAGQIKDYTSNGFDVGGVCGVNGSPTCGINRCMDMARALDYHASLEMKKLDRVSYNRDMYDRCQRSGKGLFFEALEEATRKRGININYSAYDLVDDMERWLKQLPGE